MTGPGEVTLGQVLRAREARAALQRRLLEEYGGSVISFTLNIPGPVKDSPLIRRAFGWGTEALDAALAREGIGLLFRQETHAVTGPELVAAARADPEKLKALCTAVEDASALGRLFDMDVIGPDGAKLERSEPRPCLICGKPGRGCASRRVHPIFELQNAVERIIIDHSRQRDREDLTALVTRSLIDEVNTTPKPGLVDRNNTGSHTDMTAETFLSSAEALWDYWGECFDLGRQTADKPPAETFPLLRRAGLRAEAAMLAATGGVNTHKGAVFTLGLVCGAVGRLWTPEDPCRDPRTICDECGRVYGPHMAADWAAATGRTAGERLYLTRGLTGIRGELAAGLPGVTDTALPALEAALAAGSSANDARVTALLALIARGTDTNMLARGGEAGAAEAARRAAALIRGRTVPDMEAVRALDRWFIERNLSPGGCADLLAAALFLRYWRDREP